MHYISGVSISSLQKVFIFTCEAFTCWNKSPDLKHKREAKHGSPRRLRGQTRSSRAWEKHSRLQLLCHFLFCFLSTSVAKTEGGKNPLNGPFSFQTRGNTEFMKKCWERSNISTNGNSRVVAPSKPAGIYVYYMRHSLT